ncbi:SCO family protein [Aureisphaera galaxeae]|uniref:SCO family protein n=1 Tax=Aureisphaera galaxeae TaxID=1538023 RepID=UPI0023506490|nr:SCO family protein [Aureisphaera galaxeae]MDC8005415.1 SCO family protein [Aureisphaera galaxeae]
MKKFQLIIIALLLLAPLSLVAQKAKHKGGACCATKETAANEKSTFSLGDMKDIPNVQLTNQYGQDVEFFDLIEGKVVALNFIFTSCKTICPPMGANFVQLQTLMKDRVESSELVMLTVSIDPQTDTPERLKAWSEKFETEVDWTLLTGDKNDINTLLKKLEVYTALKEEHAPVILLGKEGGENWVRTNGLANPNELAKTLNGFFEPKNDTRTGSTSNPDEMYFTNVELMNQHGENMRLYADLMKDKVVIVNPFFTECTGVCPIMSATLEKIQEHLGDKMGDEVHIISLTVDYETDQQEELEAYSKIYHAEKGWYFMTGAKENIEFALHKFGKKVENREGHDSVFLVGNVKTKLWKKVNGLANVDEIIAEVDSVIADSLE